jgi:hypothetical protein
MEHEGPLLCIQEPSTSPTSRVTFRNKIILEKNQRKLVKSFCCVCLYIPLIFKRFESPTPNPKAGGRPLVGCPRPLMTYIRSLLYLAGARLHGQADDVKCRCAQ